MTDDIMGIFQGKVEILERGALDGLTGGGYRQTGPGCGEYVLVSRMRDGSQVSFSEQKILPRIQKCIEQLEAEGVKMILFFVRVSLTINSNPGFLLYSPATL